MTMFFQLPFSKNGKLALDCFVKHSSILIPPEYWKEINRQFDKEQIKAAIVDVVQRRNLGVPGLDVDEAEFVRQCKLLKASDSSLSVRRADGRILTRREYEYSISSYYIQGGPQANIVSDFFHRVNRIQCGTHKFKSPWDAWHDPKMLAYCLNALWSMKLDRVNSTNLFNCLVLRQYTASQFRVSAAKAIYDLFGAESVLDTSMGWGDRLAGFCFSKRGKRYYGIDPNWRLQLGYVRQKKTYGQGRQFTFLCAAAEDADYPEGEFDLAFTSPPYFETERYGDSEDAEQSWVRYKRFEDWMGTFLFEVLDRQWYALKPGGFLAINIADLGVSYEEKTVCDPMNDYIASLPGASYCGCLGLRLSSRPHTSLDKHTEHGRAIFVEPIWVWRKGSKMTIDQVVKRYRGGLK